MNGVPWWFGDGVAALGDRPLESVDPGGVIGAAIAIDRVVGCVVHMAASTPEPGLVLHKMGQGLIIGEARGGKSDRVQQVADLLAKAGFEVTHSADVRRDIWYKLWGNLTINPVSAMTGATGDRILADPLVMTLCHNAMREAAAIGAKLGCPVGAGARGPLEDHREAGGVQDLDAAGRRGGPADRARRHRGCRARARCDGWAFPRPTSMRSSGSARLYGRVHGLYPNG